MSNSEAICRGWPMVQGSHYAHERGTVGTCLGTMLWTSTSGHRWKRSLRGLWGGIPSHTSEMFDDEAEEPFMRKSKYSSHASQKATWKHGCMDGRSARRGIWRPGNGWWRIGYKYPNARREGMLEAMQTNLECCQAKRGTKAGLQATVGHVQDAINNANRIHKSHIQLAQQISRVKIWGRQSTQASSPQPHSSPTNVPIRDHLKNPHADGNICTWHAWSQWRLRRWHTSLVNSPDQTQQMPAEDNSGPISDIQSKMCFYATLILPTCSSRGRPMQSPSSPHILDADQGRPIRRAEGPGRVRATIASIAILLLLYCYIAIALLLYCHCFIAIIATIASIAILQKLL